MKALVYTILLALLLLATQAEAQIQQHFGSAGGLGRGFTRCRWVNEILRYVCDPVGNTNAIVAFNPITQVWKDLFVNDQPSGSPVGIAGYGRDNNSSFLVNSGGLLELWVWSGSHMDSGSKQDPKATGTVVAGPTSGRYNVDFTTGIDGWVASADITVVGSAVTVVNQTAVFDGATSDNLAGPVYRSGVVDLTKCVGLDDASIQGCATIKFRSKDQANVNSAVVKNNVRGWGADPACAWSSAANAGICGFGAESTEWDQWQIIEPNSASSTCFGANSGGQPYIQCNTIATVGTNGGMASSIPATRPTARVQCMNCMVAVGTDVYLYGGFFDSGGGTLQRKDLWKYSFTTHTWVQLASSPTPTINEAATVLTYDSRLNKLLAWQSSKLYIYDIATDAWTDGTPSDWTCRANQTGAYIPTIRAHFYESGDDCTGVTPNDAWKVVIDGSTVNTLKLAHGQWTHVGLPTSNSPFTPGGGTKQWQVVFRPANNEMYFLGGDGGPGIHINGTYSVNLGSNTWTLRVPQCVTPPDVEPGYLTEDAITLDTTRDLIYWPGGGHLLSENLQLCAPTTDAAIMREPAMALNLTTNKWAVTSWPGMMAAGINATEASQDAVYDPVTDQMLQVYSCTGGMCIAHFHPDTEHWEPVSLPCAANTLASQNNGTGCTPRSYINSGFSKIENHYEAIDPVGRKFYFRKQSDGSYPGVLVAYDIDVRTATIYDFPNTVNCSNLAGGSLPECWNALSWDSANNVLLWFSFGTSNPNDPPCPHAGSCYTASEIFAFTPATGTWASVEKFNPAGLIVQGATVGYDPHFNAHVLIGGAFPEPGDCPTCSFYSYYFLYRYAANTNPQATILVQSTTPNSLVPMTLTPADVNGLTGGNTPFQRTWNIADEIEAVFVAAATSQGAAFSFWTGCDSVSGLGGSTCHVDATTNRTITANYATLGQRVGFGAGARIGGSVQIGN